MILNNYLLDEKQSMSLKSLRYISTFAMVLALFVVMLGAYTRLTDAGLGCPDWPGCYGHMVLPTDLDERMSAAHHYSEIPMVSRKAWTEMAHRYAAGTLGILIFVMGGGLLHARRKGILLPWGVPLLLIFLVLAQAALGMWTVTLKLLPVVVMGHLLGGLLIFTGLCYFRLQLSEVVGLNLTRWRVWISLGLLIVFFQIALGGWVSSNYAGIACIGFPTCNGQWLPALHLSEGFNLFSSVGANYQGGVLDNSARITIQWVHRLGALLTFGYVLTLSLLLMRCVKSKSMYRMALCAIFCLGLQLALGIANVIFFLPLWVAVAHNGVAALLLATMMGMRYLASSGSYHVLSH